MDIIPANLCSCKEEIRGEIDRIDREIIRLLGERFEYVKAIVKFKTQDQDIIAPDRYLQVIESRGKMGEQNGLSPQVVEEVYKTLLSYFIAEEKQLLANHLQTPD